MRPAARSRSSTEGWLRFSAGCGFWFRQILPVCEFFARVVYAFCALCYNKRKQAEPARSGPRVGVVSKHHPGGAGRSYLAPVLLYGSSAG